LLEIFLSGKSEFFKGGGPIKDTTYGFMRYSV